MGEATAIEWADHTFNAWIGCTRITPACDHCYAAGWAALRAQDVTWGGPGLGAGTRRRTSEAYWRQPLTWDRAAAAAGTRPFVFCSSLADVFDNEVPIEWLRDLLKLCEATPHLIWLFLTKRPQLAKKRVNLAGRPRLPSNVAVGATMEDRERVKQNAPWLVNAGGVADLDPLFLFGSCEPLLEDIADDLSTYLGHDVSWRKPGGGMRWISWVISGGESGGKARPAHPEWHRGLRDAAAEKGAKYLFKQWGCWAPGENAGPIKGPQTGAYLFGDVWSETRFTRSGAEDLTADSEPDVWRIGKKAAGRLLDGVLHDARPEIPA